MPKSVVGILEEARKTFEERGKVYGPTYKRHGDIMKALFPEGLTLETAEDFNRYHLLDLIVVKLNRYAVSFERGDTHIDSMHDLAIYGVMLEERDSAMEARKASSVHATAHTLPSKFSGVINAAKDALNILKGDLRHE